MYSVRRWRLVWLAAALGLSLAVLLAVVAVVGRLLPDPNGTVVSFSAPTDGLSEIGAGVSFGDQVAIDEEKEQTSGTMSDADGESVADEQIDDPYLFDGAGAEEGEEEEEDDNDNGVFRPGDFDSPLDRRLAQSSRRRSAARRHATPSPTRLTDLWRFRVVDNRMCWSPELERLRPNGLSAVQIRRHQDRLRRQSVVTMVASSWNRCGRPKNRYVTLEDGSHVCARHRAPHHYLIQGEVMSFYLARLLGMDNVPVVVLSVVDPSTTQWRHYRDTGFTFAGWEVNDTVALVQWIDGLQRCQIPALILESLKQQETISASSLPILSITSLVELMQWSDLIVFDYITGNYDRVASMQDSADRENRALDLPSNQTVHNLALRRNTLWLMDNESGLLDAYNLMYGDAGERQGRRFLTFQQQMLRTICLFRSTTVERVATLQESPATLRMLLEEVVQHEPLFARLPDVVSTNRHLVQHFASRIQEVHDWMRQCRTGMLGH